MQLTLKYVSRLSWYKPILSIRKGATRNLHSAQNTRRADLTDLFSASNHKYQIYISSSSDPFLNLSIEHHFLQKSSPSSTILFLYVNRPCVVIGRNQNPWLETNLSALGHSSDTQHHNDTTTEGPKSQSQVDLVRRRSGGGTVYHDLGNVNYSVICPPDHFTRDKHACMVTEAIRTLNPRARVNERHDIVLDQGVELEGKLLSATKENGIVRNCYTSGFETSTAPALKVSGSAYKLTRTRALHHGTCLVCSPSIGLLSNFLRSPARGYLQARGVDSVRSPVGNVVEQEKLQSPDEGTDAFKSAVVQEFCRMYRIQLPEEDILNTIRSANHENSWARQVDESTLLGVVGSGLAGIDDIHTGMKELKSLDWIFGQTPFFELSTQRQHDQDKQKLHPRNDTHITLTARNGKILTVRSQIPPSPAPNSECLGDPSFTEGLADILIGRNIHEVKSWRKLLCNVESQQEPGRWAQTGAWLDKVLRHDTTA